MQKIKFPGKAWEIPRDSKKMKFIYRNLRHGTVKLMIENLDDLWYLSQVVQNGDLVGGKTTRRIKGKETSIRGEKGEKKVIRLSIRVEKTKFKSDLNAFRIIGRIEQCPEDLISIGSHHTFNVTKNTVLTIKKGRWSRFDLDILTEAQKATLRPKLIIAVIDDGDANIGLVRESKIEYYEISVTIGGKYHIKGRESRKLEFYHQVAKFLSDISSRENISMIIIAGTGFGPENFHRFISEKYPKLAKDSVVEHIGSHGRSGIGEVLKRSTVGKIMDDLNTAREARLIEMLLGHIGKDSGLECYGESDVQNAARLSAIETLLISDDFFLKNRDRIESLMRNVKNARGSIHILNHENEAGQQLNALGGIAGVLRFKIR